jgi:hypothetical protein
VSDRGSSWAAEAAAVFVKDWRCEFRTRYALNTLGLFAFTTLVVVSLVLGPVGAAPQLAATVLPVILWLIVLFAVTAGLPRVFVAEEETHTATALRLAATPSALFCGKLAYGFTVVVALELLITPLFLVMVQMAARPARGRAGRRRLRPLGREHAGRRHGRPGAEPERAVRRPAAAGPGAGPAVRGPAHPGGGRRRGAGAGARDAPPV